MPYQFEFSEPGGRQRFSCHLQCRQCVAQTAAGKQCSRRTCIGVDVCWLHLLKYNHLRIAPSTLQGAGKGLFAMDPSAPDNAVVFKEGDSIITYVGESIKKRELDRRYGHYTAPYAIELKKAEYIDAACHRGVASLINHKARTNGANARFVTYYGRNEDDVQQITVVAIKNIRNGDEIFAAYGSGYRFEKTVHRTRSVRR